MFSFWISCKSSLLQYRFKTFSFLFPRLLHLFLSSDCRFYFIIATIPHLKSKFLTFKAGCVCSWGDTPTHPITFAITKHRDVKNLAASHRAGTSFACHRCRRKPQEKYYNKKHIYFITLNHDKPPFQDYRFKKYNRIIGW